MVNAFHGQQTIEQGIHGIVFKTYANAAERLADGPWGPGFLFKVAYQEDTDELWIVTDHLQYLLVNGTRPMSGSLNMGTNSITNVSTIDGRDISVDGYNLDTHISNTNNPHNTNLSNLGSGTLANLNAIITDATLDDSSNPRVPTIHALTHESGGIDAIDGYDVDFIYTPINYTQPNDNILGQHIALIDAAIGESISVHGSLSGLLNDDHPQYLLVNGTRSMSGSLNMGANNITNVGTVDGVTISAHAARHLPNGVDALATSVPVSIGSANSEGVATTFVRSDHVHAHGNQSGGTLHSDATTAISGFMSGSDKLKLDGVATGATNTPLTSVAPENVTRSGAVIGISNTAARSDHKHDISTATASSLIVGGSNTEGTASTLARADHTHALPAFGSTAGTFAQGNDVRLSDARTPLLHATTHQNGGSDQINVQGLLGELANPQKVTVRRNTGSNIGAQSRLNFIEGSDISLTITEDGPNNEIDIIIASSFVAPVTSVFGRTGIIAAASGDYTSDQVTNNSSVIGASVSDALDALANNISLIDLDGYALDTRQIIAGNGLVGGGNLTVDRTFDVVPNADGSIVVNANDIQVGILATDSQHGTRGGGNLHALVTTSVSGFMSDTDKVKLDGIESGAEVNAVDSVFGRIGAVVAEPGDYNSDQVTNNSSVIGASVSDALDALGNTLSTIDLDGYALESDLQNHISDTGNPHNTSIANIGSGTLAELNTAISDATLDDASASRTPTTHASTHEAGGSDELDGYNVALNYSPSSYNVINDVIGEHISALDYVVTTFQAGTVPGGRQVIAGDGLVGGGDLTADRTFDVVANDDGSIVVNANDIQVGILATDAQHGTRGGGNLHSLVTTSVNGFMSSADKTKLDGIDTGATNTPLASTAPENVTKSAAIIGIGTTAARADHKHDVATGTASSLTVGGSNTEGSSTSLARADHTHALPAFGSTAGTFAEGNDARLSDARTPLSHASTHIFDGTDEIDGDQLGIDYSPANYTPGTVPAEVTSVNHLTAHLYGIDQALTGGLTAPLDPIEDGYVAIGQGGDLTYIGGNDGEVLTWISNQWQGAVVPKRITTVQFSLTENVNNTTQYFYLGAADTSGGLRSSTSSGIQNANSCNPYVVPFDAKITKAVLTVKGVGVQNGSVTYPVVYQTDLLAVGFTSESKLDDVDFSISNIFTIGTFSVGNTNFSGSTDLDIDVDVGDMLGLRFVNGNSASLAGQTRMAFITFVLEER